MAFRPSLIAIPLSILMAGSGMVLIFRARNGNLAALEEEPRHPITSQMLKDASRWSLKSAPAFATSDADGKAQDLKDLISSKPLVILFIKEGCPCSIEAQPVFNKLSEAYKGKVAFLGVINGDGKVAQEFAKTNEMAFPVLPDPKLEIVKPYGAERSVYVALVAQDGKIDKLWPGYSKTMMSEMNERIAHLAGIPPKTVDFQLVPNKMTSGCLFSE
jgi:peroxiredoxin